MGIADGPSGSSATAGTMAAGRPGSGQAIGVEPGLEAGDEIGSDQGSEVVVAADHRHLTYNGLDPAVDRAHHEDMATRVAAAYAAEGCRCWWRPSRPPAATRDPGCAAAALAVPVAVRSRWISYPGRELTGTTSHRWCLSPQLHGGIWRRRHRQRDAGRAGLWAPRRIPCVGRPCRCLSRGRPPLTRPAAHADVEQIASASLDPFPVLPRSDTVASENGYRRRGVTLTGARAAAETAAARPTHRAAARVLPSSQSGLRTPWPGSRSSPA